MTAAVEAYEKQDFATARRELDEQTLKSDPQAYVLLGELDIDGKGGPVNVKSAYRAFSIAMMNRDSSSRGFQGRSRAARKMSKEEIVAEEQKVAALVKSRFTEEAFRREIEDIHKAFRTCAKGCDEIAARALKLGPAGTDLIPDLEELMTRDPMWMPRQSYAFVLAAMGTQAVPALARIALDPEQIASEGMWNMQQGINMLGELGPIAFAARPAMLQAMVQSYDLSGGEFNDVFSSLTGQPPEEWVVDSKRLTGAAIAAIGDPDKEIYDDLTRYAQEVTQPSERLVVLLTLAMTYGEYDELLDEVRTTLQSGTPRVKALAIQSLLEVNAMELMHARVQPLLHEIRPLADSQDEKLQEVARSALEALIADQKLAIVDDLETGKFKDAIAKADAAIEINPWSDATFTLRAEARRNEGDITGSISDYLRSVELLGNSFEVQVMLQTAGAWDGEITGEIDDALRQALENCVRSDDCYAKMNPDR